MLLTVFITTVCQIRVSVNDKVVYVSIHSWLAHGDLATLWVLDQPVLDWILFKIDFAFVHCCYDVCYIKHNFELVKNDPFMTASIYILRQNDLL